jgi:hypothetical protein
MGIFFINADFLFCVLDNTFNIYSWISKINWKRNHNDGATSHPNWAFEKEEGSISEKEVESGEHLCIQILLNQMVNGHSDVDQT